MSGSGIVGDWVTTTLPWDGGRGVTVYLPSAPAQAVVLAGDGERVARWGPLLEVAGVPPTVLVGVHGVPGETDRLREYSPTFDPERFAAHEAFFVEHVRQWVAARFGVDPPRERAAVFGASAGGELALALGLRHPDVFGSVLCASPGAGYRPGGTIPDPIPRVYLLAGTDEPFFLENARRWATALGEARADVVMDERPGTHGDALWREAFPRMVAWAFRDDRPGQDDGERGDAV